MGALIRRVVETANMIKDIKTAYLFLAELKEPCRILAVQAKDEFFREDLFSKYLNLCLGRFQKENIERIKAVDLHARRHSLLLEKTFFDTERLWIIEKPAALKGKKAAELAENLKEDFFLLIDSETIPKALLEVAENKIVLAPIKPWERPPLIASWVRSFCKKHEMNIANDAAQALAQAHAEHRSNLVQELEKIMTYCHGQTEIALADVQAVSDLAQQSTLWQLLDALLQQDKRALLLALENMEEIHEIALIRFLKNQLQKILIPRLQTFSSKTQDKRCALAKKIGSSRIIFWINTLEMREIALRSGNDQESLMVMLYAFISTPQHV